MDKAWQVIVQSQLDFLSEYSTKFLQISFTSAPDIRFVHDTDISLISKKKQDISLFLNSPLITKLGYNIYKSSPVWTRWPASQHYECLRNSGTSSRIGSWSKECPSLPQLLTFKNCIQIWHCMDHVSVAIGLPSHLKQTWRHFILAEIITVLILFPLCSK